MKSITRLDLLTSAQKSGITAMRKANSNVFLFFVAPALIIYAIFALYPIFSAVQLSFFRWDGVSTERVFVGFDNYVAIFTRDTTFLVAIQNTALWVVLSLLVPMLLGLIFALAVNERLFARYVFRTILYLPAVLASIAVATMWTWMYNPTLGIVNEILRSLHLRGWIRDWLGDRSIALFSVFVAYVWQSSGTTMVLFLAGLQNVPRDLVDSARVDGANRFRVFWHVVLPSLRNTSVVVVALTVINSLKIFDMIYGMTYGGPGQATNVLATWSYFKTFNGADFGGGMAVATVLLVMTMLIVMPYIWWATRGE